MMRTSLFAVAALTLAPVHADGQVQRPDPYASRILLGPESYTWESTRSDSPRVASRPGAPAAPRRTAQAPAIPLGTQRVLDYYGGAQARAALSQMPTRSATYGSAQRGAPQASGATSKPFNTVVSTPTVSPYLNLYRDEEGEGAPNYYAFVRPQLQQQQANQQQSLKLQQLERQLGTAVPQQNAGGARYYGNTARFGDTGHYYNGWRR